MANQEAERGKNEKDVLDQIAGREGEAAEPAAEAAAPSKKRALGWMGYLGCVLWFAVIVAAGALGWMVFLGGA